MRNTRTAKSIARTWVNGQRSENTKIQYERVLINFMDMVLGVSLDEIKPETIAILSDEGGADLVSEKYTHAYRSAGISDATIDNYLTTVRSYIQKLKDNRYGKELGIDYTYITDTVLSSKNFKKKNTKKQPVLSEKQFNDMYEWFENYPFHSRYADKAKKYALALKFMYITGIRIDAVFEKMKWNNIKYEEDAFGNKAWVVYVLDKGEKITPVPIRVDFYEEIKDCLFNGKEDELVFGDISKQRFAVYMTEYSDEKGIEALKPHSIRRGAASKLYLMTKDPIKVQHFLGHADLKTTMRYIRAEDNISESGSYILSSDINVDKVKEISYDRLVKIITTHPELALRVLSENERMGD